MFYYRFMRRRGNGEGKEGGDEKRGGGRMVVNDIIVSAKLVM